MSDHLAFLVAGLLSTAPRPPTPPILFEPNRGQAAASVAFLTRGASSSASIGADGTLAVSFTGASGHAQRIAIVPLGARVPRLEAVDRQQAVLNILKGRDASKWLRGVPLYSRVRAGAIYQGIDIEYLRHRCASRVRLRHRARRASLDDPSACRRRRRPVER